MQTRAVFQLDLSLPHIVVADPGSEGVAPGRDMIDSIAATGVALLEVGRFQDQDRSAHPVVDLAMNGDYTGLIENNGGWFLFLAVTAEIKALGFGIRKNVVISVVDVRKIDGCADLDGKQF